MFILLPYKTSITPRRTPYANYLIIAVNVLIFLLEYHVDPHTGTRELRSWVYQFWLFTERPELWQFVSYAFLHESWPHIIGNMFFLYLFGNNVNDKLGNVGYLAFYLSGAVYSAIGHWLLNGGNVIGASGAVAAVTGAYLVLFPQTLISIFWWLLFFINTIELPALYFIAFKLIFWDNIIEPQFAPPMAIAHSAHLAGYAFGIATMVGLLATGLISSSHFDLWNMIKQWNRRRAFRDIVSNGYDPFTGRVKSISVKEVKKTPAQQQAEEETLRLRSEISNRLLERNLSTAANAYLELMSHDSEQILPGKQLLDIANQLAGESRYAESAQAYEQFLIHYSNYEYVEQVELMLGIIYARYLNKPEPAIKHLQAAEKKLLDQGQLKLCRDELKKLTR